MSNPVTPTGRRCRECGGIIAWDEPRRAEKVESLRTAGPAARMAGQPYTRTRVLYWHAACYGVRVKRDLGGVDGQAVTA
jgi:hypothetical protein